LNINNSSINDSEINEDDSSINNITVINNQEEKQSSSGSSTSADQSVYIRSVKEQAKKLNRLNTESELRISDMQNRPNKQQFVQNKDNQNNNYVKVYFKLLFIFMSNLESKFIKASLKNQIEVENFDFSDVISKSFFTIKFQSNYLFLL
jgi:hypothetical protein